MYGICFVYVMDFFYRKFFSNILVSNQKTFPFNDLQWLLDAFQYVTIILSFFDSIFQTFFFLSILDYFYAISVYTHLVKNKFEDCSYFKYVFMVASSSIIPYVICKVCSLKNYCSIMFHYFWINFRYFHFFYSAFL